MLSAIIFIASAIAVVLGIAAVIFVYGPYIVNGVNQLFEVINQISSVIPSWLAPFLLLSIALGIISIIIKLL